MKTDLAFCPHHIYMQLSADELDRVARGLAKEICQAERHKDYRRLQALLDQRRDVLDFQVRRNGQHGQAILEALAGLLILTLLILGGMDMSILILDKNLVENAAVSACRYGAGPGTLGVRLPLASVEAEALSHLTTLISFAPSIPTAKATLLDGCQDRDCRLQLEVSYQYTWLFLGTCGFDAADLKSEWIERYQ